MFRANKEGGENEMEHRSLASRYAALQDGKGRKRRKRASRDEHDVLNIQLAIFTDRFLLNTVGTQRGIFFKEFILFRSLFNYFRRQHPDDEPTAKIDQVKTNIH